MKKEYKLLFSMFLGIIFTCSLVFANHIITTSTGGTSYSVDEDTIQLYNISVNNTDALFAANITQVNITIPSTFSFSVGSNGTDAGTHTFTNTSIILNWSNDGLVLNLTTNYFWFNATASTPGTYNLTVTTLNITRSYSTNISVTINDITNPEVTIVIPLNTTYSGTSRLFNVTVTDNVLIDSCWLTIDSGVTNYSMTNNTLTGFIYNLTTITDGNYNVIYSCNDTTNNINNTQNVSFRIYNAPVVTITPPGDGGTYTLPFWTSTNIITKEQFDQGVTKELSVKSRIKFKVNNIDHHIGIKELTTNSATIEISSDPSETVFSIGEEKEFDITGDGYYDIYVKLNSITNSKAEVILKSIYKIVTEESIEEKESAEVGTAGADKTTSNEGEISSGKSNLSIILLIIGILIILSLIIVGYDKYKKGKILKEK